MDRSSCREVVWVSLHLEGGNSSPTSQHSQQSYSPLLKTPQDAEKTWAGRKAVSILQVGQALCGSLSGPRLHLLRSLSDPGCRFHQRLAVSAGTWLPEKVPPLAQTQLATPASHLMAFKPTPTSTRLSHGQLSSEHSQYATGRT